MTSTTRQCCVRDTYSLHRVILAKKNRSKSDKIGTDTKNTKTAKPSKPRKATAGSSTTETKQPETPCRTPRWDPSRSPTGSLMSLSLPSGPSQSNESAKLVVARTFITALTGEARSFGPIYKDRPRVIYKQGFTKSDIKYDDLHV